MRRHKGTTKCPTQKTTQAQKTPTTPTAATTATSTGALHPLCGGAPVTWRCTRTEEVHCLRIGCSAPTYKNNRGTGTPNHSPPHPSMRSWALLVAGRARRPRHHLHPGPLRHLPHPYMRKAGYLAGVRCGRHAFTVKRRVHRSLVAVRCRGRARTPEHPPSSPPSKRARLTAHPRTRTPAHTRTRAHPTAHPTAHPRIRRGPHLRRIPVSAGLDARVPQVVRASPRGGVCRSRGARQ